MEHTYNYKTGFTGVAKHLRDYKKRISSEFFVKLFLYIIPQHDDKIYVDGKLILIGEKLKERPFLQRIINSLYTKISPFRSKLSTLITRDE